MKSFILALTLTICVTAAVVINSFAANTVYDNLLYKLEALPISADVLPSEAFEEQISELSEYFEKKKYYLYSILPQGSLNELMCAYTEAIGYLRGADDASYKAALEKTKLILKVMKDNEGLRLDNLLSEVLGKQDNKKRYFS